MTLVQPTSILLAQPDLRPNVPWTTIVMIGPGLVGRGFFRIRTSTQAYVWRFEVMLAFWQSLLFIALAEMGDKTQLVALAFATRFSARVVLGAIFVATLLVHLFSVAIGEVLGLMIPTFWLTLAAGVAFIGFGVWTLRGDSLDDDSVSKARRFGPFVTVAIAFFLAELGDKTMLATVTLASQFREAMPVWLGSTLGMVIADGVAVIIGLVVGKRLPTKAIKYGSAAVFILSGVVTIGALMV
jgi:putative Ca2+/H+ antiporter (TMEM165/GDT1 family)